MALSPESEVHAKFVGDTILDGGVVLLTSRSPRVFFSLGNDTLEIEVGTLVKIHYHVVAVRQSDCKIYLKNVHMNKEKGFVEGILAVC